MCQLHVFPGQRVGKLPRPSSLTGLYARCTLRDRFLDSKLSLGGPAMRRYTENQRRALARVADLHPSSPRPPVPSHRPSTAGASDGSDLIEIGTNPAGMGRPASRVGLPSGDRKGSVGDAFDTAIGISRARSGIRPRRSRRAGKGCGAGQAVPPPAGAARRRQPGRLMPRRTASTWPRYRSGCPGTWRRPLPRAGRPPSWPRRRRTRSRGKAGQD